MAEWEEGASLVLHLRAPRALLKSTDTLDTADGSAIVVLGQVNEE